MSGAIHKVDKLRIKPLSAAVALSLSVSVPYEALAQELEEVVVTASRRAQSITEVPYNISALTEGQLKDNRIGNINDVVQFVAGLSYVDTGPSSRGRNNNLSMRGINVDSTSNGGGFPTGTVAPVSMYINETPLFIPLQIRDVERVEVLRGPQGTLYGSGALSGTVRFINKKPDFSETYAEVEADLAVIAEGSDDMNKSFAGLLNLPLSDTFALRLSGAFEDWGGFIDQNGLVQLDDVSSANNSPIGIPTSADPNNVNGPFVLLPEKEDSNDAEIWHLRVAGLWNPTESVSVLASYYHQEDEVDNLQADFRGFEGGVVDSTPAANNFFSPNTEGPINFPTGGTDFRANEEYDVSKFLEEPASRETDLFAVDVSADLGFATLTSATSYYEDQEEGVLDLSGPIGRFAAFYGFIPRLVDHDAVANNLEGFVQELRLVSSWDKPVDFVIGAFYQKLETDDTTVQHIPGQTFFDSLRFNIHGNPQLGDLNFVTNDKTEFEDRALFGELTWHVTEQWQITGGVRAFWQDFKLDSYQQLPFCGAACGSNALGELVTTAESDESDQIFKINTSYDINDDVLIYFTASQGFRRGGSNKVQLDGPFAGSLDLLVYEPDTTDNIELGIKGSFGGHFFTAAIFQIDWDNTQINARSAAAATRIVVNGSKALSEGLELELNGTLFEGLTYNLAYAYTDASIDEDLVVSDLAFGNTVTIVDARKGDNLPNTPKNSLSLALQYQHSAWGDWDMSWRISGFYRDKVFDSLPANNPALPDPRVIDSFSVWNASISLQSSSDLSISFYVDNLFDERAETGGTGALAAGPVAQYYFVGRPRTVGLQFRYSFGG
jgi:outer membrane receptor protein involved in Fe transport